MPENILSDSPSGGEEDIMFNVKNNLGVLAVILSIPYIFNSYSSKDKSFSQEKYKSEYREENKTKKKVIFSRLTKFLIVTSLLISFIIVLCAVNGFGESFIAYLSYLSVMLIWSTAASIMYDLYIFAPDEFFKIAKFYAIFLAIDIGIVFFHKTISYEPKIIEPPSSDDDDDIIFMDEDFVLPEEKEGWSIETIEKEEKRKNKRREDQVKRIIKQFL